MRVDVVYALFGHFHFGASQGGVERNNLPVQIAQAHGVVVHEVQFAHTAAGQHLYHIAAHAAHAEDGHAGIAQSVHGVFAEEHTGSGELVFHCVKNKGVKVRDAPRSAPMMPSVG